MSDKSTSSRSSTPIRTGMPKPATQPISDCERRRISITRLERQNILIDGYKKFLIAERNNSNSTGIAEDIEMNLQETIQARDKLVSELRTLPPCLDVNCPDHSTLKSKDNDNLNDSDNDIEMISPNVNSKKSSLKRKNSKGSSDGFVFPSKSARPITPTPVLNPIVTSNSFDYLEQDAEIAQAKSPEIPEYIEDIKKRNAHKFPTAPSPSPSKAKRSKNKRATVSPTPGQGKNNAPSTPTAPATTPSPLIPHGNRRRWGGIFIRRALEKKNPRRPPGRRC
ncbi:uncharacterized protein TNIN_232371 [Trichonephila inaurata madagascariensis]|uniref:Uncharacterized protein n=1 Tax=Trichonephila inaurata madagascariensis TaxID=2747483 RepID=A0A8X6MKM4_9ARAC|nr:uncharacterized protein TNIN_232371 [Trichonephila inaurata madagascariensis]